jgi:alcohol dehydrogenase class IV
LEKVQALTEQLQVPGNFRAAGLTPAVFDYVVKNCRSGSMRSNPRPMSDDEVIALLQKLS